MLIGLVRQARERQIKREKGSAVSRGSMFQKGTRVGIWNTVEHSGNMVAHVGTRACLSPRFMPHQRAGAGKMNFCHARFRVFEKKIILICREKLELLAFFKKNIHKRGERDHACHKHNCWNACEAHDSSATFSFHSRKNVRIYMRKRITGSGSQRRKKPQKIDEDIYLTHFFAPG